MIRCPHRVNFRLTENQWERYGALKGYATGAYTWTELCLKALEELCQKLVGPMTPLGTVPSTINVAELLEKSMKESRELLAASPGNRRQTAGRSRRRLTSDRSSDKKKIPKKGKKLLASKNGTK